ncbi:AAA domain-containing protein [Brachyspira intermedia]|uniref:AAA domain-containing protein n=1 Tax=Brachyspira intermedia TaxID=84377 RepID=UPI003004882F
MKVKNIDALNSFTLKCDYNIFNKNDIDKKFLLNKRIEFCKIDDDILAYFPKKIKNYNKYKKLEYRPLKMSYLREYVEYPIEIIKDEILIDIHFASSRDKYNILEIINDKHYLAYIEDVSDDNKLIILVKRFYSVENVNLKILVENNKNERLEKDYIYNSAGNNYIVFASEEREEGNKYYIVGEKIYREIDIIENNGYEYYQLGNELVVLPDIKKTIFKLFKGNHEFIYKVTYNFENIDDAAIENKHIKVKNDNFDNYLDIWYEYEDLEVKQIFNSLFGSKYLEYDGYQESNNNEVSFTLKDNSMINDFILNTGNISTLTVSNINLYDCIKTELHDYVSNNNDKPIREFDKLSYVNKLIKKLSAEKDKQILDFEYNNKLKNNSYSITLVKKSKKASIPKNGYIMYSIAGSFTMHRRRKEALELIQNKQSAMTFLHDILLKKPYQANKNNKKIKPITNNLIEFLFTKNKPTENQKEAIDIALNTPDIALIQGPPGTGKTTVIVSILYRLLENIGDINNKSFGSYLISSHQHDAVQNVRDRITNYGLPVPEIGEKKTDAGIHFESLEYNIEEWINEVKNNFEGKHIDIVLKYKENSLFDDIKHLKCYNDFYINETKDFMTEILTKNESVLSYATKERINSFLHYINSILYKNDNINKKNLLDLLFALPIRKESYEDGGINILKDIISYIDVLQIENISERFKNVSDFLKNIFINGIKDNEFQKLRKARNILIIELSKKNIHFLNIEEKNEAISIFDDIMKDIDNHRMKNINNVDDVLMYYYSALKNEQYYIRDSIKKYSYIIGATNQKANSNDIVKNKNNYSIDYFDKNKTLDYSYDNVLLDEAARSNPLDLIIPMSLSKGGIVIVGDHRQLPQITDREILDKIIEKDEFPKDEVKDKIEKSMFEYLWKTAKDLEKQDGIKRTVTLNKQYRMHPVLGNFVNDYFYKPYSELIESPRPAEEFSHKLPDIEDKACVWIDVNKNKYKIEEKVGTGYKRKDEAEVIAEHIKKMFNSEYSKGLTFGIITYYRDQVNIIREAVNNCTSEEKRKEHELIIGTVDAFQGREFDVVYLSMVRSNENNIFGFLEFENRLCVSMSRQKKLLISVGDLSMFTTNKAKEKVRAIYEFANLCMNNEYGKVIE